MKHKIGAPEPVSRLLDSLSNVVFRTLDNADFANGPDDGRQFLDKLTSDDGYITPRINSDPVRTGLDLLNAYFSVETFYLNNAALFQGKDITNVVKADWCRSLGWHYGYMLRERTLTFLNMLRGRFDAAGAAALSDLARRFKKATDAQFTERGRHVHNESEDDPLARQLGTLESFAGEHELIGRIFRARQRRVRKLIRDRVRNEGEKIQAASVDVIMQSEKFWTKLYAEIAQDAVSRAKSA